MRNARITYALARKNRNIANTRGAKTRPSKYTVHQPGLYLHYTPSPSPPRPLTPLDLDLDDDPQGNNYESPPGFAEGLEDIFKLNSLPNTPNNKPPTQLLGVSQSQGSLSQHPFHGPDPPSIYSQNRSARNPDYDTISPQDLSVPDLYRESYNQTRQRGRIVPEAYIARYNADGEEELEPAFARISPTPPERAPAVGQPAVEDSDTILYGPIRRMWVDRPPHLEKKLYATNRVYVKTSTIPGAGLGLFASRNFHRGEPISSYGGRFVRWVNKGDEARWEGRREWVSVAEPRNGLAVEVFSKGFIDWHEGAILGWIDGGQAANPRVPQDTNGRVLASYANNVRTNTGFLDNNAELKQTAPKLVSMFATKEIHKDDEIFCQYGRGYWTAEDKKIALAGPKPPKKKRLKRRRKALTLQHSDK